MVLIPEASESIHLSAPRHLSVAKSITAMRRSWCRLLKPLTPGPENNTRVSTSADWARNPRIVVFNDLAISIRRQGAALAGSERGLQ